jgi:hypothetical protein
MRAFLFPLIGGLVPLAYFLCRRLRQVGCRHSEIAMDPSGRTLCLNCWKGNR